MLSIAGGAAGVALAIAMAKTLLAFLPYDVSGYSLSSSPDVRMLAFTSALSLVTGIAFGLVPRSNRPGRISRPPSRPGR